LKDFQGTSKEQTLDKAIATILNGEIAPATKSTLMKQIEQPLPDVKEGKDLADADIDVPNMRPGGGQGGLNRQARLLPPSGDPQVFKVVSLVLGSPDFQRQ
jgi:hypothetical protein